MITYRQAQQRHPLDENKVLFNLPLQGDELLALSQLTMAIGKLPAPRKQGETYEVNVFAGDRFHVEGQFVTLVFVAKEFDGGKLVWLYYDNNNRPLVML